MDVIICAIVESFKLINIGQCYRPALLSSLPFLCLAFFSGPQPKQRMAFLCRSTIQIIEFPSLYPDLFRARRLNESSYNDFVDENVVPYSYLRRASLT